MQRKKKIDLGSLQHNSRNKCQISVQVSTVHKIYRAPKSSYQNFITAIVLLVFKNGTHFEKLFPQSE